MAKKYLAAKDVVAGMSIRDPNPGALSGPRVLLVVSTEYRNSTKLLRGKDGEAVLVTDANLELLLMEDPGTGQCRICHIGPDAHVELAAPKFVLPPPSIKGEG